MIKNSGGINYLDKAESTNTYLLNYPEKIECGTAVYTLNQTKGRGRLGRSWEEQKGKNLAISAVYNLPVNKLAPMPLIAGMAVVKALSSWELYPQLKWSNDVILNGKKLAGILCESRIEGRCARLVVGIGINLGKTTEDFAAENLQHATSLLIAGADIPPGELAEAVAKSLGKYIEIYISEGFESELKDEYESLCVNIGKDVIIHKKDETVEAKAIGISPDGALIYEAGGKEMLAYGGEVSVRGLEGYI